MSDRLRKGMWITHSGKTGIIFTMDAGTGTAEVHYTDEKGVTTEAKIGVPQDEISQAAFKDIPKARRPDKPAAKNLGYL